MAIKKETPKEKDTTVFKEKIAATPTEGFDVEKEGGIRKFVFEKDNPKHLTRVTNTGLDGYGEKVAINKKTDKSVRRTIMIMGNTITIEPDEVILVSTSLIRFFSTSMGFEHENVEMK